MRIPSKDRETWQERYARTGERFNKGPYAENRFNYKACQYWIDLRESCMSDGDCACVRNGKIKDNRLRRLYGYPSE